MAEMPLLMPVQSGKSTANAKPPVPAGKAGGEDSFADVLSASQQSSVPPPDGGEAPAGPIADQLLDPEGDNALAAPSGDLVADVINLLALPAAVPLAQSPENRSFPTAPELAGTSDSTLPETTSPLSMALQSGDAPKGRNSEQATGSPAILPGSVQKIAGDAGVPDFNATGRMRPHEVAGDFAPARGIGNGLNPPKAGADTAEPVRDFAAQPPSIVDRMAEPNGMPVGMLHTPGGVETAKAESVAMRFVATHVESPSWSKDFGQNVIRLTTEGQTSAEIHLNPPDWGPIHISLKLDGEDASVKLIAEHAGTREALNAAIPHLRELFQGGGMNIVDATVAAEGLPASLLGSENSAFRRDSGPAMAAVERLSEPVDEEVEILPGVISSLPAGRRVDLFA